jgi:hypothetical protein
MTIRARLPNRRPQALINFEDGLPDNVGNGRLSPAQIATQDAMRAGVTVAVTTGKRAMMRAALAKPRRSDRASVAFRRAVDGRTDCSRSAGSVHPAVERSRSTVLRQDKRRKVRAGRTVEERKQINHLARGAFRHCTSSLRTSYWKIETTCTSQAAHRKTGPVDRSVARRVIRPFCPGQAPWHTATMKGLSQSWRCA